MKKSKLAIASFVLSLLPIILPVLLLFWTLVNSPETPIKAIGVLLILFFYTSFFTFWFSVLAIILGIIALVKIKRNNLGGKWLVITNMIISVAVVIIATMIFQGAILEYLLQIFLI
ncbi:MAG: DUF4190 domain-containing protein [Patescibacteria group bacterium]